MRSARSSALWWVLMPAFLFVTSASAATPEEAMARVEQTAEDLQGDTPGTLAAINAGDAPYRDPADPTSYVCVYDMELTVVAHPDPKILGKNKKGVPDSRGKLYRDEILAGALSKGSGWEDYHYTKPGSEGQHPKRTYYERVTGSDDKEYIVCSGIYLD